MKRVIILFSLILMILSLMSCTKSNKQVLYVFNWTDYISPDIVKAFEQKYNCRVQYDTYNSNENMLTKVLTSQAAYDIIVPSGDHVVIMRDRGLLEKIDKNKLPNWKNLNPLLLAKAQSFDPGNEYSIPYFWGTSGLIFNKQLVPDIDINNVSWTLLGDKRFTGKNSVTMLDDAREVLGAALIVNGFNPNDMSEASLSKARTTVLEWDKNISQYDSDSFKNEIQDGTTAIAQAYNGDALQIMEKNKNVGFALPKEGSTLWIDSIVIPKTAEHKELAYAFIDFILEANNAKENAEYVQYATPNKAAFELLPTPIKNNRLIYPEDAYINRCYLIDNVGQNVLKVDKIWQEIHNN